MHLARCIDRKNTKTLFSRDLRKRFVKHVSLELYHRCVTADNSETDSLKEMREKMLEKDLEESEVKEIIKKVFTATSECAAPPDADLDENSDAEEDPANTTLRSTQLNATINTSIDILKDAPKDEDKTLPEADQTIKSPDDTATNHMPSGTPQTSVS